MSSFALDDDFDSGCSPDSHGSSSGDCAGDETDNKDAGSWGKSFEKDDEDVKDLTDGAENNNGDCELVSGLTNLSETITVTADRQILLDFITSLKLKLKVKADVTIVSNLLLDFQAENPRIWEMVAYQNITLKGFILGRFSKIVAYKQSQTISGVVVLDENDDCPLIQAFLNASQGVSGLESAAQGFCDDELRPLLLNTTLVGKKKHIAIAALINKFIARNAEYRYFLKADIDGFGSISSYIYVTETYTQLRHVKTAIKGANSILVLALEAKYEKLIAEGKLTIAVQFSNIINEIKIAFQSETSFRGRLARFIKLLRTHGRLNFDILQYVYSIYLEGFGNLFDFVHCGPYLIDFDLTEVTGMTGRTPHCVCTCN